MNENNFDIINAAKQVVEDQEFDKDRDWQSKLFELRFDYLLEIINQIIEDGQITDEERFRLDNMDELILNNEVGIRIADTDSSPRVSVSRFDFASKKSVSLYVSPLIFTSLGSGDDKDSIKEGFKNALLEADKMYQDLKSQNDFTSYSTIVDWMNKAV